MTGSELSLHTGQWGTGQLEVYTTLKSRVGGAGTTHLSLQQPSSKTKLSCGSRCEFCRRSPLVVGFHLHYPQVQTKRSEHWCAAGDYSEKKDPRRCKMDNNRGPRLQQNGIRFLKPCREWQGHKMYTRSPQRYPRSINGGALTVAREILWNFSFGPVGHVHWSLFLQVKAAWSLHLDIDEYADPMRCRGRTFEWRKYSIG